MTKKSLGEIAELTAGVIIQRILANSDFGEEIYVLVPKAIHDGMLDEEEVTIEKCNSAIPTQKYDKFLIEEGEIAMKLSSPYDACKVTKKKRTGKYLIPSFCCKIKVTDPNVDVDYLVAFLNSSFCKKEMEEKCYTRTNSLARKSNLETIMVPILSMEEQKEIAERNINLLKLKQEVARLIKLEDERNNVLFKGEDK